MLAQWVRYFSSTLALERMPPCLSRIVGLWSDTSDLQELQSLEAIALRPIGILVSCRHRTHVGVRAVRAKSQH